MGSPLTRRPGRLRSREGTVSRIFEWDEIPPCFQAFLKEKEAQGCKFKSIDAAKWTPAQYFIRSELLPLYTGNFQHFSMDYIDSAFYENDSGWWKGITPVFGGGGGWTPFPGGPKAPSKIIVTKHPAKRTLNRYLQGMRFFSQPNCLVVGTKIRDILLALGEPEDRFFKMEVRVEKTEEFVGTLYLYDPPFVPDMIDYEHSSTSWGKTYEGDWLASAGGLLDRASYPSGLSIRIARIALGQSTHLISKDLAYTFFKHKVPSFDGRDPHKIYHNHIYEPKLLVGVGE